VEGWWLKELQTFRAPIVASGHATPLAQALAQRHRVIIDRRMLRITGAIVLM
jgi:hypothetical protein